jgi:hypothetical protein
MIIGEIIEINKNDFEYIIKNKNYLTILLDSVHMMPSKNNLLGIAARLFADQDVKVVFNEDVVLEF